MNPAPNRAIGIPPATQQPSKPDFWDQTLSGIHNYGSEVTATVLQFGAAILIADTKLYANFGYAIILFAASIGFVILELRQSRDYVRLQRTLRYEEARREHLEQSLQNLPDTLLTIATANGLPISHSERLSIYLFDEKDEAFRILARKCTYRDYARAHRGAYPADEGCIGYAWRHGRCSVENLPDLVADPQGHLRELANHDITLKPETLEQLRMKSRCYHAMALTHSGRQVAVVVYESENPHLPVTAQTFYNKMRSGLFMALAEIVVLNEGPIGRGDA